MSREYYILTSLAHRNVIRLLEVLQDERGLYLVMEYAPGGDVYSLLRAMGRLGEATACSYAAEVVLALGEEARFYPTDAALASWRAQADQGRAVIAYE